MAFAPAAHATVYYVALTGFDGEGGVLSGGFDLDTSTDLMSSFSVTVTPASGSEETTAFTDNGAGLADCPFHVISPCGASEFSTNDLYGYFSLGPILATTPVGGVYSVTDTAFDIIGGGPGGNSSTDTSWIVTETIAPEPATLGLVGFSLLGLGGLHRRRKKQTNRAGSTI